MCILISNKVSGLIRFIFNNSKRVFFTIRQVESFTDGWIREQCNLTSWFPNVFVQGLNVAKNCPTSLIWTEYTTHENVLTWLVEEDIKHQLKQNFGPFQVLWGQSCKAFFLCVELLYLADYTYMHSIENHAFTNLLFNYNLPTSIQIHVEIQDSS